MRRISLILDSKDWFINKYFYWKTGRDTSAGREAAGAARPIAGSALLPSLLCPAREQDEEEEDTGQAGPLITAGPMGQPHGVDRSAPEWISDGPHSWDPHASAPPLF